MFQALATSPRASRFLAALGFANDNHQAVRTAFMISRDGKAFLEVNGAEDYVLGLLEGFAAKQGEAVWTCARLR